MQGYLKKNNRPVDDLGGFHAVRDVKLVELHVEGLSVVEFCSLQSEPVEKKKRECRIWQ